MSFANHLFKLKVLFTLTLTSAHLVFAQVGLYQGTFDPPHISHEEIVRNAIRVGKLEVIYILAMPDNPAKPNATSYPIRQQMVEDHFSQIPEFRGADLQILHAFDQGFVPGLFNLIQDRHPGKKIFHVIGSDAVTLYPETQREHFSRGRGTLMNLRDANDFIPMDILSSPNFLILPELSVQVSSTEIRRALQAGRDHFALSPSVLQTIRTEQLYKVMRCQRLFLEDI